MRRMLLCVCVLVLVIGMPASASPLDGDWLLLHFQDQSAGTFDLYLVHPDGTGLVDLTGGSARDHAGVVSPDREQIAVVSDAGTDPGVWVMDADGANRRELAPPYVAGVAWTPDGRIVYSQGTALRIVARDGSGDQAIVEGLPAFAQNIDVSPDGTTVVFDYQVEADRQVYSVPLAGGAITRLTTEGGFEPEYSPDGSRIVFVTFRAGYGSNIWVMAPDGSDQRNLFVTGTNDFNPSWSPDGSRIVYESVRDEDFAIVIRDLATGATTDVITTPTAAAYRDPVWVRGELQVVPTTTAAPPAPGGEGRSIDPVWIALVGALVATATIALLLAKKSPRRDEPPPPPPAA